MKKPCLVLAALAFAPAAYGGADGDGSTVLDGDCNDYDPLTYPGAPEICDGIDDNCDAFGVAGLQHTAVMADATGGNSRGCSYATGRGSLAGLAVLAAAFWRRRRPSEWRLARSPPVVHAPSLGRVAAEQFP